MSAAADGGQGPIHENQVSSSIESKSGSPGSNGAGERSNGEPAENGEFAQDIFLWEHGVTVEPWPEPVHLAQLLDDLEALVTRFVTLPAWAPAAIALWIVHTFAFHLRFVTTYIGLESPEKRCGKTTLLTVLSELVNRPVIAANISSPAFFRVIADKKPTLLIDEADTVLHRNRELKGILNSGYARRAAYVIRMATKARGAKGAEPLQEKTLVREGAETNFEPRRYSSWCPKAIAMIKHLPETLADRCIVIAMQRKSPRDKCERLRNLDGTEFRRKCARYVADHADEIARAEPGFPDGLNDRACDIWEPLFVLADMAGGAWPEKARNAALALTEMAQEESPIGALLVDIFIMFGTEKNPAGVPWDDKKGGARIFSRDMAARLSYHTARPWQALVKGKITENWLAQQLRPYDVRPRTIWIGQQSAKGYVHDDFLEVFRRYLPKSAVYRFIEESRQANEEEPKDASSESPQT